MAVSDTSHLDAAIWAGCAAFSDVVGIRERCRHSNCGCTRKIILEATLRAAFPREATPETLAAMRAGSPMLQLRDDAAVAAYRALPLYRELWPEEG